MMKRETRILRPNQSFSINAFIERTASTCRMQTAVTVTIRGGGALLPIRWFSACSLDLLLLQAPPFYKLIGTQ